MKRVSAAVRWMEPLAAGSCQQAPGAAGSCKQRGPAWDATRLRRHLSRLIVAWSSSGPALRNGAAMRCIWRAFRMAEACGGWVTQVGWDAGWGGRPP